MMLMMFFLMGAGIHRLVRYRGWTWTVATATLRLEWYFLPHCRDLVDSIGLSIRAQCLPLRCVRPLPSARTEWTSLSAGLHQQQHGGRFVAHQPEERVLQVEYLHEHGG